MVKINISDALKILSDRHKDGKISSSIYDLYSQIFEKLQVIRVPNNKFKQVLQSIEHILTDLKKIKIDEHKDYFFRIVAICEYIVAYIFKESIQDKAMYEKYAEHFSDITTLLLELYPQVGDITRADEYNSFKGEKLLSPKEVEFDSTSETDIQKAIKQDMILPYSFKITKKSLTNTGFVPIVYNRKIIYQNCKKTFTKKIETEEIFPLGYHFSEISVIHPKTKDEFIKTAHELLDLFKHSVEQKKGYKVLWEGDKSKAEPEIQIYFDNVTSEIAQRNGIEYAREAETG